MIMNEDEYQAHSTEQAKIHTAAQQNFTINVANIISIVLYYIFIASFILSGISILYVLYGDIAINYKAPQWLSIWSIILAIVGVMALNLSYKYTNTVIKYSFGYHELLYTEKVLLPLRIFSAVFLIAISAVVFLLPAYPVWAGIATVLSYRLLWVAKMASVPLSHYMCG